MKVWTVAILLTTLLTYGCKAIMGDGGLAVLDKQMAVLELNLTQARRDLASGDLSKQTIVAALERQLAALQEQQKELATMLATAGKAAGLPTEVAVAGGGLAASLIAAAIGVVKSLTARRKENEVSAEKESRKRKELWVAVEAIKEGGSS